MKALETSPSDPKPPQIRSPLPLDTNTPPQPTWPKNDDIKLNIDMASVLEEVNVHIPLTKIMKTPSLRDKVKRFLSIQDESEDPPILLQAMHYDRSEEHVPFFISLVAYVYYFTIVYLILGLLKM